MPYDYTDIPPRQKPDLISEGTVATVNLHIRPGGVGEDGQLRRSKEGACEMLDIEFTVLDGPHKGRKFWEYWILEGTTQGHADMAAEHRRKLKAVLDSAFGLQPNDKSDKARKARNVSLRQFEGMTFMAKIGIEKGRPKNDGSGENWDDKNILASVITPDKKDYHPVEKPPPFNGGGTAAAAPSTPAAAAAPVERPKWA